MIRNEPFGQRVETERLSSDFMWTWVRFSDEEKTLPIEFVLLGGTSLEFEGRQVLKADQQIEYLRATRIGDLFRVETNQEVLAGSWSLADFATVLSGENSEI